MPCFKGLAVSIHTPNGPIAEYSVQRQSRFGRISCYIPVPPARASDVSSKPEQSTFAISITLLTPGQEVPYSAPKATKDDPYPSGKTVGSLPGLGERSSSGVGPYIPLTTSANETIAAYIYFDGRTKEEVATLLRRGEETWVNSRWVGIPESEGGGLAEREFLFREVGLERWLNGLDLEGKDAAAKIERRRQKMERRRVKRENGSDNEAMNGIKDKKKVLRYGADATSPVEDVSENDAFSRASSDSDDDDPIPEAAGQIKVALFRVIASGEIKRGEYSPQFDAHDDDEESSSGQHTNPDGMGTSSADADHTTSFAQPKSLDPRSISTQTVTGIDATDKPYAVFTFFYRGERQLQKMGILNPPKVEKTPTSAKRRSIQDSFSTLGPLKKSGTVGFSQFRDRESGVRRNGQRNEGSGDEMEDSDSDEDRQLPAFKMEDVDGKDGKDVNRLPSPEDAEKTGQLAEGVRQIKLKRAHSAEPLNESTTESRKSTKSETPSTTSTPKITASNGQRQSTTPPASGTAGVPGLKTGASIDSALEDSGIVGSPLKKQRASLPGSEPSDLHRRLNAPTAASAGMAGAIGEILGAVGHVQQPQSPSSTAATDGSENRLQFGGLIGHVKDKTNEEDEEL
ncbi:MAG: hypothetical protein Q9227_003543 [Pyrenula ochraceoflavens]